MKMKKYVFSLGGGAFLTEKTRLKICSHCYTVWLKMSAEKIYERLKNDKTRPLLLSKNTILTIQELIDRRSNQYSKSDLEISCDGLEKREIIAKITSALRLN